MTNFKAGELVVVNLPANRRGKTNTVHGCAGVVIVEARRKWSKRADLVTTVKLFNPHKQRVHLKHEHLIKATPELYPELYV